MESTSWQILSRTLKPYAIAGLGINSSDVENKDEIQFYNNTGQSVQINSGGRTVGLGIIARVGADYYFNNKLGLFTDIGIGTSLIQIGAIINLQ